MFEDPFYKTHDGEIFVKSRCMYHERNTVDVVHNILKSKGYAQEHNEQTWTLGQKKVIVCLADDFIICGADRNKPSAKWFDRNTTVITDDYMPHSTDYRVLTFPPTYFGVFNYTPELQKFNPTRRFGLSINRIDGQRLLTLLELIHVLGNLENDYVNFNCHDPEFSNNSNNNVKENFLRYWNQLSQQLVNRYVDYIPYIVDSLPIRNHNLSVEQAHVSAYLTLVIETYAGNDTIAFSEKIFRALVTPSPWMLFSARNAVQYLKTLGFDVVDDLIDHGYDLDRHQEPNLAKISKFYKAAEQNYQKLISIDLSTITDRCQKAARHNQQQLTQFQNRWPEDFKNFLSDLDNAI